MPDTSTLILFLSGPFLSLLISWILGQGFDRKIGSVLAFGACLFVSLTITLLSDAFFTAPIGSNMDLVKLIVMNFAAVAFTAYGSYERVWKPFGVSDKLNSMGPQQGT